MLAMRFDDGNLAHVIRGDQARQVVALVGDLLDFKRRHRGVITSSDYCLDIMA
jgi:hypothetical protein